MRINTYRWNFRNGQHARGELSHKRRWEREADFMVMPGASQYGRNRAFTRAMRSANPPEPSYDLLTGRITSWTGWRTYTHPRSARA